MQASYRLIWEPNSICPPRTTSRRSLSIKRRADRWLQKSRTFKQWSTQGISLDCVTRRQSAACRLRPAKVTRALSWMNTQSFWRVRFSDWMNYPRTTSTSTKIISFNRMLLRFRIRNYWHSKMPFCRLALIWRSNGNPSLTAVGRFSKLKLSSVTTSRSMVSTGLSMYRRRVILALTTRAKSTWSSSLGVRANIPTHSFS